MAAQEAYLLHEADDEILASSSSSSSSDHGWQKVTYPKRQRKIVPQIPSASDPRADPRSGAGASSIFASVEKKALERRRALEETAPVVQAPKKTVRRQWGDSSEEESSEAEESAAKGSEVKKKKEKKVKKPKITVQEAGSNIDSEDLAAFLVDIGGSYESQEDILLMRFADYYARAFRDISSSQFPWTKMFKESPLSKIADVPISFIPEPVYKVSADWIGQRSNDALTKIVLWSLDNLLVDLAAQQGTLKVSKKGVQPPQPKGQVAMFVVLGITLRRKPEILSNILSTLRTEHKYQGVDKLPILTWLTAQAAQGDPFVGLYAWVHNLLPLLSGKLGSNPQVRDLVLQSVERTLSLPKARSILLNSAVRKGDRLVPPSALDQLMHLTFVFPSARVKATERFEAIYPTLKELALAGSAGSKSMKPVLLQLLPSSIKAMQENVSELSAEASDLFIWCLTQNTECLKQWEKIYIENIQASLAVLQKLSSEWKQQYAAKFSSSDALRDSLKNLREMNQKALAGDLNPSAKAAIKEADKHCKAVLSRTARYSTCSVLIAGTVLAAALAAAALAGPAADSWDWGSLRAAFSSPPSF